MRAGIAGAEGCCQQPCPWLLRRLPRYMALLHMQDLQSADMSWLTIAAAWRADIAEGRSACMPLLANMAALLSGTAVLQGSRSSASMRRQQLGKGLRSLLGSSSNQADFRMMERSLESDTDASDSDDASDLEEVEGSLRDPSL